MSKNILNKDGKTEYLRVKRELKKSGMYYKLDRSILIAYSVSWQTIIFAQIKGSEIDFVSKNHLGHVKVHPYLIVFKSTYEMF